MRTVGDLIDGLAGLSDAQLAHLTRRAGGLSGGADQALGLAVGVLEMRAALAEDNAPAKKRTAEGGKTGRMFLPFAANEPKGGDDEMRPLTGAEGEADVHREAHRLMRLDPTIETFSEAVLLACSERPHLYAAYNAARMREAARGVPPVDVRPEPTKGVAPDDQIVQRDALAGELLQAVEASGQSIEEYCAGDGAADYAVLNEMIRRGATRERAEEITRR